MHILVLIIGAILGAAYWFHRAKAAKEAAGDLLGAANDVRLAARRLGFQRKTNKHPFDQITDPRIAAAGIAAALASMDSPLTEAEINTMTLETQVILKAESSEADDIAAFGRWLAGQGGTPDEAVRKLSKITLSLAGREAGPDLVQYCNNIATVSSPLDERQAEALKKIETTFGIA